MGEQPAHLIVAKKLKREEEKRLKSHYLLQQGTPPSDLTSFSVAAPPFKVSTTFHFCQDWDQAFNTQAFGGQLRSNL
jgi:hypothetical protein